MCLKGAQCNFFGGHFNQRRKTILYFYKGQHNFILCLLICLYVADPATFLALNSVLDLIFPLGTACLFSYGKKNSIEFVLLPH